MCTATENSVENSMLKSMYMLLGLPWFFYTGIFHPSLGFIETGPKNYNISSEQQCAGRKHLVNVNVNVNGE